jgi:hypothetical protein
MATQAIYAMKQAELYTICFMAWDSCLVHLTDFTAFSAGYTAPAITARKAQITAAKALPDYQARNSTAEIMRVQLIETNTAACDLWQKLKRYISYAFPSNQWQIQWDAAGMNYYLNASNLNWDSTEQLMNAGKAFITANSAALLLNNNMPATFSANFTATTTTFTTKHQVYLQEREDVRIDTQAKVLANNQIYTNLIAMLADGKLIYQNDPAVKNEFTLTTLMSIVSNSGLSGVKGTVADSVSRAPLAGVTITIIELNLNTTTDVNGFYTIDAPSGSYTLEASGVGITTPITVSFTIATGVQTTVNVDVI